MSPSRERKWVRSMRGKRTTGCLAGAKTMYFYMNLAGRVALSREFGSRLPKQQQPNTKKRHSAILCKIGIASIQFQGRPIKINNNKQQQLQETW
mmetsp:Transcript_1530/g.2096  ORF Transcript_1530/g.2096 Transcript_1530/m.2096 type:complete len:94 (-) Transcript_1530:24-305(-)